MELLNKALSDDINAVEEILKKGVSANIQTSEGTSALHIACANNFVSLAQILLKYGAIVDLQNNCGWTPLMLAAFYNNNSVVELLMTTNKCNVKLRNKLGLNPLTAAVCGGNLQTFTLLLKHSRNTIDQLEIHDDAFEISLLRTAVLYERVDFARYILDNKTDANYSSPLTKTTALMLAASVGNHEITKLLIDYGADPNAVNVCHQTANEICSILGNIELKSYLAERTLAPISYTAQSEAQIFEAIEKDDIEMMKSIIKSNLNIININYNKDGLNPLTQCVLLGKKNMALCLIQHGADLNIRDKINGYTPLMHAVNQNKVDMLKFLLDCGANVDTQGKGGCTALDLAWMRNDAKEVADLILTSSKKNRQKLGIMGAGETLNPISPPITRTRNSFRNSFRHDSFKGIVGSISQKFMKNRKSSGAGSGAGSGSNSPAPFSPTPSFLDEEEVFTEAGSSPGSKSPLSNAIKLSAFEWPTIENIEGIGEWMKPVVGPSIPNSPALASTIPGEYRPLLKECVFANQKKSGAREGFVPSRIISKLNTPKSSSESSKFDNSFSKSDSNPALTNLSTNYASPPTMSTNYASPKSEINTSTQNIRSVEDALHYLSLDKYAKVFQENEIDLQAFKALTEADLEEMGISDKSHRCKLLSLVLNL